jgi:hypothetical protein
MAWTSQRTIREEAMRFAGLKNAQTGSAAHPVSPVLSTGGGGGSFHRGTYQLPPSSAEVKNERRYTSISPYLTSGCTRGQLQVLPST